MWYSNNGSGDNRKRVDDMRYAIYYRTNNGCKETLNCQNKAVLDLLVKNMIKENCCAIAYAKIYKSGEYSARKFIKGNAMFL